METHKISTCSFVVKVWVEEVDDVTDQPWWRGHITHVFSGRRQYFENLATVTSFITHYLQELGVSSDRADHSVRDSL